jgi:hypothetical protein
MAFGPKKDGGRLAKRAQEMFAAGKNCFQISNELGVAQATVHRWVDPVLCSQKARADQYSASSANGGGA